MYQSMVESGVCGTTYSSYTTTTVVFLLYNIRSYGDYVVRT